MRVVAVDTGGTFTDFIYEEGGEIKVLKIPSTPEDPSRAVVEGLKLIGRAGRVVHGSTVATNALLERKGAKTALITNRGFEDVIEIGRQNRERLYDLHYRKPKPIVPRALRLGILCRIGSKGEVIEDIREEELEEVINRLKELKVEAVAVSLLHSYANPSHEVRVGKEVEKALGIHVSMSHEIVREMREYERTSTTVINAYLSPVMSSYLSKLERDLNGTALFVMQSNGGLITSTVAGREAVRTILSGPAGGVIGAVYLGRLIGREKVITLDMGGTSTDVSLIEGSPTYTTEERIEGMPIKIPMIEIHTIGAGGGSIAWIDEGGALRVGPGSAGAQPGPACYGRGGKDFTVTDANLWTGRIHPGYFLGGKMKLRVELTEEPLGKLSRALNKSKEEVAHSVLEIANSNMERALRKVSLERGHDPEEFSLLCFGGGGPLHGAELARNLRIKEVIIPPNPGLFSAFGMLCADVIKDYSLTLMKGEDDISHEELESLFMEIEERALREMEREGFETGGAVFTRELDMRFEGQSYEITVPFTQDFIGEFKKAHTRLYGYIHDRKVQVVTLRLRCTIPTDRPALKELPPSGSGDPTEALIETVKTSFGGEVIEAPIYLREKLKSGVRIESPAIVVEYSSTTFIPPGYMAHTDRLGNIILRTDGG